MSDSLSAPPLGANYGQGKKSKSSVFFAPVNLNFGLKGEDSVLESTINGLTGEFKSLIDNFIHSKSTDNQISIMKDIIDLSKINLQDDIVKFIVVVLFESEPKHPVKCLLIRHLERWTNIHEIVIKNLSTQIMSYCNLEEEYNYAKNNFLISRLGACLDNFSLGFQAVKLIENHVVKFLLHSLTSFLEEFKTKLPPEEKQNLSKMIHQTLRILLVVIQKATVDTNMNKTMISLISDVIMCSDVAVDDKCLCAMIYIALLKLEDQHPWDRFKECPNVMSNTGMWSTNDTTMLCFYYAVFTGSPHNVIDLLDYEYSDEAKEMFHDIVQQVVDITERVSESVDATMAGARTVAIIASRLAAAAQGGGTAPDGGGAVPRLPSLRAARGVERALGALEGHTCAAPRHLAAHAHLDLLHYYLHHHPQEGTRWLSAGGLGAEGLGRLRSAAGAGRGRGAAALRALAPPALLLPALADTHTMLQASSLLSTYISLEGECASAELVHRRWLLPTLSLAARSARAGLTHDTLDHLVALLATAVDLNNSLLDYILPLIQRPEATDASNIKCTLFLMHVVLKSKAGKKYQHTEDKWKGIINYDVFYKGILHDDDQVVSMCVGAGVCGGGSAREGGRLLAALLRAHAARPVILHARTLQHLHQFLNRLESDYRTAKRKDTDSETCQQLVEVLEELRQQCFDNLVPGGNHYRRGIALYLLKHIHTLQIEYDWIWSEHQVSEVLRHIDDSYDTNRQMAFDVLLLAPHTLVKEGMMSSGMGSVEEIVGGSGARARDAGGAALRVQLLLAVGGDGARAGERALAGAGGAGRAAALRVAAEQLRRGAGAGEGVEEVAWAVLQQAAPLVEAASPEGHVPPTFFGHPVRPHPHSRHLFLIGDEVMTSQTMLLSAWTSAKEAWELLCSLGVSCPALGVRYIRALGERLLRVRHRALLDHAAAAYATLLQHYYMLSPPTITTREREEIEAAFDELEAIVRTELTGADGAGGADGTRRGAGLTALAASLAALQPAVCARIAQYVADAIRRECRSAPHVAVALLRSKRLQRSIHRHLQQLMLAAFDRLDDANTEVQWSCAGVVSAGVRRALGPAPTALPSTVFRARYPALCARLAECVERGEAGGAAALACALVVAGRTRGGGAGAAWPAVAGAAHSPAAHIRRLAAAATANMLTHNKYLDHEIEVLNEISEPSVAKNLCHGLILRLIAMLESAPELGWSEIFAPRLSGTLWIMETSCYPLMQEYINLAMLIYKRCPSALEGKYRVALGESCAAEVRGGGRAGPGRAPCAGAAVAGAAALLPPALAAPLLDAALRSQTYEVCLASLQWYLTPRPGEEGEGEIVAPSPSPLSVHKVYTSHPHPECRRLALQLLVQHDLLSNIVQDPSSELTESDDYNWIILKLYEKWEEGVESERGLFVEGIRRALGAARGGGGGAQGGGGRGAARAAAAAAFASSALTAPPEEREAADALLKHHADYLLQIHDEDDDLMIPMCIYGGLARQVEGGGWGGGGRDAVVGRAGATGPHSPALLLALALLDFAVPIQEPDETSQYRAFKRSWDPEVAEEGIWTAQCAALLQQSGSAALRPALSPALRHVAGDNLTHFLHLMENPLYEIPDVNPKVVYLVNKLKVNTNDGVVL